MSSGEVSFGEVRPARFGRIRQGGSRYGAVRFGRWGMVMCGEVPSGGARQVEVW